LEYHWNVMVRNRVAWFAGIALVVACVAAVVTRALLPAGPLAPDFTLTDQTGHPYTLSAHRGHAIALFRRRWPRWRERSAIWGPPGRTSTSCW